MKIKKGIHERTEHTKCSQKLSLLFFVFIPWLSLWHPVFVLLLFRGGSVMSSNMSSAATLYFQVDSIKTMLSGSAAREGGA